MQLFFRKEGIGSPLIILHGLYGASDNWFAIAKKLAERYTVYSIDLRNHGQSPHHEDHTFAAMKADLVQFFDTHNIETAALLGHSMGGKVAMAFAADFPERVTNLIVVDIAPKNYLTQGEENLYPLHRNILTAMLEINFDYVDSRQQVEENLSLKIDNARIRQFLMKNLIVNKTGKPLRWKLNLGALYDNLEEIVSGGDYKLFEDRLPITTYPVRFIRGLASNYIQENDLELIKRIYPDAQIVDIPNAGHWLHAEQPDLFMQAVLRCC